MVIPCSRGDHFNGQASTLFERSERLPQIFPKMGSHWKNVPTGDTTSLKMVMKSENWVQNGSKW